MKAVSLPAWLFQTRNLFTLTSFADASLVIKVEEIALPLLFVAIVISRCGAFRSCGGSSSRLSSPACSANTKR